MPTPQIETGDAEQHRNPTDPDEEIEDVEGIENDDDLDLDDDLDQPQGSTGGPLAILQNKKVLLGLLVAAAILLYLKHNGGGSGNSQRRSVDDPADIASHVEGEPEHGFNIRQDLNDPLVADEDVIAQSGAFPSLQRGS